MESIKEKINKYINDRGLLKTPAHYVKELFNDIVNKVSITENIISFDTNELNIDTKNGYYYNENLIDSIKITMIDDIIQPKVEFNGLSPKIELPKNIIVNNKLINYNGIGKYVLSFNNNTCDIERYKCDFTKAPSGYVIATYDSDMLGDGYLSYNGAYTFISLDRDYTANCGPVLDNEKFISYVGNSIDPTTFAGCSGLTSVEIGDSVTSIGQFAFAQSTITSVVIPNSVTIIGEGAFYGTGLTSITIPNSVTTIDYGAFLGCTGLTSIEIPNSVTTIEESAFQYCSGLTSIVIGNSVTSIGMSTFTECALKSVVWNPINYTDFEWDENWEELNNPFYNIRTQITSFEFGDQVEHIPGHMCYEMSNLTSVVIPNQVSYIGMSAFQGCSGLTSITIPDSVTIIGDNAFFECSGLTSVEIGNSVTSIGSGAFFECSGLTSVEIGNSVTSIGSGAFNRCSGLTSVEIGNSVNIIGGSSFYGCTGLTSVVIPDSVTSIGSGAFNRCSGLTSITIPDSVTNIEYDAFTDTPWLNNQPDGCVYINNILYTYKGKMSENTHIDVNEGTTQICEDAFSSCSGLTSITIPNSVNSIGYNAFYNCTGLTSITIPNSVTTIDYGAFLGCTGLTSIEIPNSVTSIGDYAFNNTPWLENQPDGCVYINNILYTYKGEMSENTHIDINEGTTQICGYAFQNCWGLTSITIPDSVTSIGRSAFDDTLWLENQPDGCMYINNMLYTYKGEMTENTHIDVKEGTTQICDQVFVGYSELTSITIPNSVTSIGKYVFRECSKLNSITITSTTPPTINMYSFEEIFSYFEIKIYVPDESVNIYKTAPNWSLYASKIKPLSEKPV